MSTWNYRVVQQDTPHGRVWALHEVYYNKDGSVMARTEDPISFASDESLEDLLSSLRLAAADASRLPVLVDPFPESEKHDEH